MATMDQDEQEISPCKICHSQQKSTRWRCLDCLVLMCDNCKVTVHAKMRNSRKHNLVDAGGNQSPFDINSIPCSDHENQKFCVYCLKCEQFICPKCLTRSHQRHKLAEMQTIHESRLKLLRKYIQEDSDSNNSDNESETSEIYSEGTYSDSENTIINTTEAGSNITPRSPECLNFPDIKGNMKFLVTKTYRTDIPFVHRIISTENALFISCWNSRILAIKTTGGKTLENYLIYNDKTVYDMALAKSGHLILTCTNDSKLYRLHDNGKLVSLYDFDPLQPLAVHVTGENIIVSTRDKGDTFSVNRYTQRQVVVLDQTGKGQVRVFENDDHGRPLFSLIHRLTATVNSDIIGIDRLSINGTGKIVNFDTKNIKWIYRGNVKVNMVKPFVPLDVAATPRGNVIVAETDANVLHILSAGGRLINCLMTKEINIILPMSLDIDTNGRMWIGCGSYKRAADKAKIHAIAISGF